MVREGELYLQRMSSVPVMGIILVVVFHLVPYWNSDQCVVHSKPIHHSVKS